jgi:hypothetical protein
MPGVEDKRAGGEPIDEGGGLCSPEKPTSSGLITEALRAEWKLAGTAAEDATKADNLSSPDCSELEGRERIDW